MVIDTAIYIPQDSNNWIFGRQALLQGNRKGELIRNFKMDLINPETEEQAKMYVRKFMGHVFSLFVKQTADVNYDSMDIYISYPVKWPTEKKTLMKNIISESGFGKYGEIMGKTEPVAAAIELMRIHIPYLTSGKVLKMNTPLNILMLDMGAGTSDLFLFQLTMASNGEINIPEDKIVQYPVAKQPYNCGGREIDDVLSEKVLDYLSSGMGKEAKNQWFDSKKAKEWKDAYLSRALSGKIETGSYIAEIPAHIMPLIENLKDLGQWNNTIGDFQLSRSEFEAITKEHWVNLYKLIENGIAKFKQECKIGAEDIDLILLTGGHSQWYCLPRLFNGDGINGTIAVDTPKHRALNFAKIIGNEWKIMQGTNPRETVANGLCWPEGIIYIPSKAEDNKWMKFGVNGVYGDYRQIAEKGEMLPKHMLLNKECAENVVAITQNAIFASDKFYVEFIILEGETLESAEKSVFKVLIDEESILGKALGVILTGGFVIFTTQEHKLSYDADVTILEDGTISLNGSIYYNANKKTAFTDKNFQVL